MRHQNPFVSMVGGCSMPPPFQPSYSLAPPSHAGPPTQVSWMSTPVPYAPTVMSVMPTISTTTNYPNLPFVVPNQQQHPPHQPPPPSAVAAQGGIEYGLNTSKLGYFAPPLNIIDNYSFNGSKIRSTDNDVGLAKNGPIIEEIGALKPPKHACDYCPKTFKSRQGLRYHMFAHTGNWPYRCPTCHRGLSSVSQMKQHVKTHSGLRQFGCTYAGCEKRFTTKHGLVRHTRTHSGEKPYSCHACFRKFGRAYNLRRHQRTCRVLTTKVS